MHIAIDTTALSTLHRRRGIGWYTHYLVEALRKYEGDHKYTFFTRGEKVPKNANIIHFPYFDLFFSTLPAYHPAKTVVTIHDLTPIIFLSAFRPGLFGRLNWFLQKKKVKKVAAIITDSQSSKRDIIHHIGYRKDDVHVIYLAPAEQFKPIRNQQHLKTVKDRYQLRSDFILYVGDINYNKNIPGLIKAFASIVAKFPTLQLVLVGEAFLGNASEAEIIDREMGKYSLTVKVRRLGFVPTEDLVGLYNLAQVYVQPSFYEGFGLPLLEAMACGCPVVTTDQGALTEVAGGAAVYVNAENEKSITQGTIKVLTFSKNKRQKLVNTGLKQAKNFSWKKTAHQTVAVYKKVGGEL